ncbi:ADP compounds hydrolase NudE [uncultured Ferrimonas sp.]|uniref:ADP compounds hydrolase NudE n=1 Tax=uncultured Ferrimonas sp. TaxID=432640 RepID=UPI00261F9C6E|nr:ADP compounds hydrolase NudE [uncultured Ferrimonas sp.]
MSAEKPEILSNQLVAQSRLFKVEQLELRFSNGERRTYERMRGGSSGAVMVVPMIDAEHMLLVREYAAGTHSYELGFPKGLIDPGEVAADAANRELQEEIGYGARTLQPLQQVALAPSYFSSKMDIFLAQDLYPSRLQGDEPEPLEVVKWPIADIDGLLAQSDFSESRSITALFLARKRLKLDR